MANSYTTRLKKRLPTAGDSNWDDEWHDNEKLDDVVQGSLLSINRVISGGVVTDGSGLTANFATAEVRLNGTQISFGSGNLMLTGSQANWIYINNSGVVVTSLTPPSGDYIPLALVDTDGSAILRIADLRPMAEAAAKVPTAANVGQVPTVMPDLSLAYQPMNRGRKNHIINGNFDIWQRAVSQTSNGYGSDDRWLNESLGTTKVHSQQAFALGQTLVPGDQKYFSRTVVTSVPGAGNHCRKSQRIERVATNAGRKATYSFYFDVDTAKNIAVEFVQNFGTGGSPSAEITAIGAQLVAVTPGFKKYVVTVDLPSVAGKALGTGGNDYLAMVFWFDAGSSFDARTVSLGQQSGTFDLARVQLEEGVVATEYEMLPPEETEQIAKRFYNILSNGSFGRGEYSLGITAQYSFPISMRGNPAAGLKGTIICRNFTLGATTTATSPTVAGVISSKDGIYFELRGSSWSTNFNIGDLAVLACSNGNGLTLDAEL